MAIKLIEPDAPSQKEEKLVRVYKPVPMLPREEAIRMRRSARNAADSLMPWVIQRYAEIACAEDNETALKALDALRKIALAGKSNEEVDPDAPTVDGKVVDKELEKLEKMTESTGTDTE